MEKQKVTSVYQLTGVVGWWEDHQHDPDELVGKELDVKIEAPDDKKAIAKAKKLVASFLKVHKQFAPGGERVPAGETSGYWFRLMKITDMWLMRYDSGKPEVPAKPEVIVPAKPGEAAVLPSVKEIVF